MFHLSQKSVGTFDVVLFLGVLYHLQDPLGAMRKIGCGHQRNADP